MSEDRRDEGAAVGEDLPGDSQEVPEWLAMIEHTGDTGFIVTAEEKATLFSRAAWGLFSVIADLPSVRPEEHSSVTVEAEDLSTLMVRWLSELNFRHITEHRLFCEFRPRHEDERRVTAEVAGEKIDFERHTIFTEVKAVTYHELQVAKTDGLWQARIILDL